MNILRILALIFGIVFLLIGFAGFIPSFLVNGNLLFGIFQIDNVHNFVHIASGLVALFCAIKTVYARLYFQIFGVVYALVTILGFATNGDLLLMHVNTADNILHLVIAIVSLYIGFFLKPNNDRLEDTK